MIYFPVGLLGNEHDSYFYCAYKFLWYIIRAIFTCSFHILRFLKYPWNPQFQLCMEACVSSMDEYTV